MKILYLYTFLLLTLCGYSQNLVPNPSFEDTANCPDTYAQITYATGWQSFGGTPDYFNSCSQWNLVHVPNNAIGYQYPSSGNAYVGMVVYDRTDTLHSIEYIGTQLTQSLVIGQKYFASFKINLPKKDPSSVNNDDCAIYACNKIGILLSTVAYTETNSIQRGNFAHVYTDSIIVDTLGWVNIVGSFIADSAYNYLSLGNFFENNQVDTIRIFQPFSSGCDVYAYYFVDDICLSTDSLLCTQTVNNTEYNPKPSISIFPNPFSEKVFIKKNDAIERYDVIVYSALGEKLFEKANVEANSEEINTSLYLKGILYINIKTRNQSFHYKLIKS